MRVVTSDFGQMGCPFSARSYRLSHAASQELRGQGDVRVGRNPGGSELPLLPQSRSHHHYPASILTPKRGWGSGMRTQVFSRWEKNTGGRHQIYTTQRPLPTYVPLTGKNYVRLLLTKTQLPPQREAEWLRVRKKIPEAKN